MFSEEKGGSVRMAPAVKAFRETLLADPDRPGYHFCDPEGIGDPGDPNGCFYANGRYHMMYLYRHEEKGFCWGHVSSVDLLHWRHHPDCIMAGVHGRGCFSGGAFLDDDGKCYITFWDFVAGEEDFGGIRLAVSDGEPYEQWRVLPGFAVTCSVGGGVAAVRDRAGKECIVGGADPSNIWKKSGKYYMQTGNLCVLDRFSRGEDPPEDLRGDWADLFSSADLKEWTYEGRFYDRKQCLDTADSEDCMCPSFLPLPAAREGGAFSGKYLELFIAHNRGCQFYTGVYDEKADRFLPEKHGRMSVVDSAYFAPEALVGPDGRQIMWAWLRDNPDSGEDRGWSGVFGMARELWYADDSLRMAPAREYERLRINPQSFCVVQEGEMELPMRNGRSFVLRLENLPPESRGDVEVRVRVSADGSEYTRIYFDAQVGELVLDSRAGSARGWAAEERIPVALPAEEPLTLEIYVDQTVIEVYANDRGAIGRRVYPAQNGERVLLRQRSAGRTIQAKAWEMAPCNPF